MRFFGAPAQGEHRGVLIWPDIFGVAPNISAMATRLAESGIANSAVFRSTALLPARISAGGFSLHANVDIAPNQREKL